MKPEIKMNAMELEAERWKEKLRRINTMESLILAQDER